MPIYDLANRTYVYIAAPYSGRVAHGAHGYLIIEQNILNARIAMAQLVEKGYGVFCPHTHSAHFEVITPEIGIDYWYDLDLYFLQFCHVLLRLPGQSSGADGEMDKAQYELSIPIYTSIERLFAEVPPLR
jgi:hypothetical protein